MTKVRQCRGHVSFQAGIEEKKRKQKQLLTACPEIHDVQELSAFVQAWYSHFSSRCANSHSYFMSAYDMMGTHTTWRDFHAAWPSCAHCCGPEAGPHWAWPRK
jgi:hypothetical protein